MTIGIMPDDRGALPLLCYGGSSVFVTFIAIGLRQSIYVQARMTTAGKSRACYHDRRPPRPSPPLFTNLTKD